MNSFRSTSVVLAAGIAGVAVGIRSPNPPGGAETWLAISGVYLLAGAFLGGRRVADRTAPPAFRDAVLVAAVSVLGAVAFRVRMVQAARPDLGLADQTVVLWQPAVLLPIATAAMLTIGAADAGSERTGAVLALVAPFLAGTARWLVGGFGFGPAFGVAYHAALLLVGVVAGLPLSLYARCAVRPSGA